ncbi:MAG TPA: hypothetical protein VHP83_08695 [Aggregatilineaceae bacterium]|nr:hypothetical protein [Aggregatilineaceae bacterium]
MGDSKFKEMWERVASLLTLSQEELAEVAEELRKDKPSADRYILIRILGKGGGISYRQMVEGFLNSPGDPMLAQSALWTLCIYWGLTGQYLPQVQDFVQGVSWDSEEDVRISAITIAGEYLRAKPNPTLLRQLMTIFENPEERQIVREVAYRALGRAIGRAHTELPGGSRSLDWAKDIDPTILQAAKRRFSEETSE